MAVTQQIARLTPDELDRCRASVEEVHRLCSFALRPSRDHLELDWWPSVLERAAAVSGFGSLADAIERACGGGTELNRAYRDAVDSVWQHPVTALEPSAVCDVAARLQRVEGAELVAALPRDPEGAARVLGLKEVPPELHAGLAEHYTALRRFYVEACEEGLATAMWWD